jgi:hypothetical protein
MKALTETQIQDFKRLAKRSTTTENHPDDWNPGDMSGGNFDDCYWLGHNDADIENARFILDLLEIEY